MQTGEISFCDRIAYNIKSDDFKKHILEEIYAKYGCKIIQKHHERFDEKNPACLQRITKIPHLCSTRTNGNPYFLYLTRIHFGVQCIFIDKKIQQGYFYPRMILVKLWFDDALFDGTVMEGEMVKNHNGVWQYVINDLLAYKGQSLSHVPLTKTVSMVHDLLKHEYIEDDTTCCEMRIKKYFHYEELPYAMESFIPHLNYTCRGIYFKPLYKKFRDFLLEFDQSLIKREKRIKVSNITQQSFLTDGAVASTSSHAASSPIHTRHAQAPVNPAHPNTVVFYTRKTNKTDVYELSKESSFHDTSMPEIPCIPDLKTSRSMSKMFETRTFLESIPLRYTWHPKFHKWYPLLDASV